jgi:hypothetical protein
MKTGRQLDIAELYHLFELNTSHAPQPISEL